MYTGERVPPYHRGYMYMYPRIMASPAAGFGRLARSYYDLPVNGLLVGLARQRVGMTVALLGGKKNGMAMCACTTGVSWYFNEGTRQLLGRAAESIARRERLVSWLSQ